ncbi:MULTISPECIES: glycoside hydrolase family 13 protein [unclassified Roseateles]|uniref:glycoside hydrolase family 13 protein n=1 Tax=unclassified Roseateles TaxID=2626991 RepID=UPI0006F858AD|nr:MULTISPECIES: glycoside hydrolase family 13 protein [unclassified Roseateles]KQW43407.1 alpha-amlyase [Pelomonas sp. Root405]KRA71145.1 alpha-amlyase [Pelomonas sp. Root662]
MKTLITLATALLMSLPALAAEPPHRVEPPNWWVGMRDTSLQLMLHGPGIADAKATLAPYPGVTLKGSHRAASGNYLFVDLDIGPTAKPGELVFDLAGKAVRYPLLARTPGSAERQGFGPKDAIYLVVPDRFAKAGSGQQAGMKEGVNRADHGGRHGGDLAGMRQHLGYIAGLGFTQVWPTPLVENNSAKYSYHGYAATDFYRIDPRFGSNDDFGAFVAEARATGLGVIHDVVLNHIGSGHWWMKDLPAPDWVNVWPEYTETHHARMTLQDPYASASDRKRFTDGWFVPGMPDLNQRRPELATYLIQKTLWWVERFGLSGIRTDTYSYSDRDFLSRWSARVMQEYPRLSIVGEEWSPHPAVVAYWQRGKRNHDSYVSHTPSMMDFPLQSHLLAALTEDDGPFTGLTRLYEGLAHDFVYPDPAQLVLFEGNHDTPRLFSLLKDDVGLTKLALAYLATTRRIPQVFYGSEILMQSPVERDDGRVRADMPGGWAGDAVNAFTGAGLSAEQRDMQDWVRRLFTWRKGAGVIHDGALMQYAPMEGCYVFFRYDAGRTVMVALNKSARAVKLPMARFSERIGVGQRASDVLSGKVQTLGHSLTVPARSPLILQIDR